ncbi:hypothetical protein POSPLADRAFT_1137179 [Postia placenta MAD-698-R-SB12]|uniref:Uncharacterized protein n=1 Tax=Postia placenta MAD-698-R-SB12 TaxID=670580 RepID=A0A1X6N5K2_9APHY|nr:hypothetical protein POSPLADRAFT_1137179 [Postia placenta MAD-698-R-SB12]OSX63800.1 hypothetical protein POSPLADRAFT_1137179 [Postia placenta MAD-698-R-SB12]
MCASGKHTPMSKAQVSHELRPVQSACVQEAQPHGQGSCKLRVVVSAECVRPGSMPSRTTLPFLHVCYGLSYGLPYGLSYSLP